MTKFHSRNKRSKRDILFRRTFFHTLVESGYVLSCRVAMNVIYVRPSYTADIALKALALIYYSFAAHRLL